MDTKEKIELTKKILENLDRLCTSALQYNMVPNDTDPMELVTLTLADVINACGVFGTTQESIEFLSKETDRIIEEFKTKAEEAPTKNNVIPFKVPASKETH